MTKSYLQILKQIEGLKAQAENARRKEISGVVGRIREAIEHYGLTASDLGLSGSGAATGPKAERKKPGRKPGRPKKTAGKASSKVAPKFRDEHGNTWAGRGKRPIWLRDALLAGKKLEDYAIK
jgi:DNA-binding protein H-NS